MTIFRVAMEGIRCFREPLIVVPSRRDLLVTGQNGSGKTTFLEAIYTAMRGRSFRTSDLKKMIADGKESFESRIDFSSKSGEKTILRFRFDGKRKKTTLEWNGESITHAQVSRMFPLLYVDRDLVDIVSGEPARRRGVLDWIAFHVERCHTSNIRLYRRAYVQWRQCVRRSMPGEKSWWMQAVEAAEAIELARKKAFSWLDPSLDGNVRKLLPGRSVSISYSTDIQEGPKYGEIRDAALRGLRIPYGPQHSSFLLSVDGSRDVRGRLSRGQQKRLAVGILWAAMDVVSKETGRDVHVLLDDFPSDLDPPSRESVFAFITECRHQSILTSQDRWPNGEILGQACSTWNIM